MAHMSILAELDFRIPQFKDSVLSFTFYLPPFHHHSSLSDLWDKKYNSKEGRHVWLSFQWVQSKVHWLQGRKHIMGGPDEG